MPNKERYAELQKAGICPLCGVRPPQYGKAHCRECREKAAEWREDHPEYQSEYYRSRRKGPRM